MATDRLKVLAYLPEQTYQRLVQFQHERGLSMSQAVTLVIEDYFGLTQESLNESLSDRLAKLEATVAALVDSQNDSPGKSKSSGIQKDPQDASALVVDELPYPLTREALAPLSLSELRAVAEKLKVSSYKKLKRAWLLDAILLTQQGT